MTDPMSCRESEREMAAFLAGGTGQRERATLLAHTARCARCASALGDYVTTSVALDRAYAPLRERTARISSARVRLALLAPERVPVAVRLNRLTARLTEFGLAAAVVAFAFVGAGPEPAPGVAPVDAGPAQVTATFEARADPGYVSRRIGRYLLHDNLLDAGGAPLSESGFETLVPQTPGQPY